MIRRLPPLNGLRAFEAAGRLSSFSGAAKELHVTPAAISHQIKGLEDYLGVQLFRRSTRRLFLTEEGRLALSHFREGFDQLARGVEALRSRGEQGVLTVSTSPSFAAKWLLPRIGNFSRLQPGVDLRLTVGTGLVDFDRDPVDLAIRFGRGRYERLNAYRLFQETLTPVLSPALVPGIATSLAAADLAGLPLLHDDSVRMTGHQPGWREWFRRAGVADPGPLRGIHFDDGHLALQAAIQRRGVALGRLVLALEDLKAGALVAPCELRLALDVGYYVVVPEARAERPAIAAFRKWLQGEAAQFEAELAAVPSCAPTPRAQTVDLAAGGAPAARRAGRRRRGVA